MANYYTGIGSRNTPSDILLIMSSIGKLFNDTYTLRSGGAEGADKAFEKLVTNKDIFLPWKGFNNNLSELYDQTELSSVIAREHLPHYQYIKHSFKKLMNRNVHQVLGMNCDRYSDFVICWTPDGAEKYDEVSNVTGGTGLAIKIADHYNIPVYNLKNQNTIEMIKAQYNI